MLSLIPRLFDSTRENEGGNRRRVSIGATENPISGFAGVGLMEPPHVQMEPWMDTYWSTKRAGYAPVERSVR